MEGPNMQTPPDPTRSISETRRSVHLASRLGLLLLVGFVLVYFQALLIPVVLAIFLSFLLMPLMVAMTTRGVPSAVAILGVEITATLPVLVLILVFSSSLRPLGEQLPMYQDRLIQKAEEVLNRILTRIDDEGQRETLRRELGENLLPRVVGETARIAKDSVGALTTALGSFMLTLLLSAFMLNEARRIRDKFAQAFGPGHPLLESLEGIGVDVRRYVVAKTWISALTAFCVWGVLAIADVDFALFWGLLAFPLNFIPTVGAIAASIPPILITLIDPEQNTLSIAIVTTALVLVNGFIGSVLDPRFVGNTVRLSPLVVLLSMLVWGLLWGPAGMILAVPIMVAVKVICLRVPGYKPIATLMQG